MKLRYQLPEIFKNFFTPEFLNMDPTELKATCHDCAMAPHRTRRKNTYRADLKCCTYQPFIPNYIVGAVLNGDAGIQMQELFQVMIQERNFVLPLGIVPSLKFQSEFMNRKPFEFGNRQEWLCPYFDKSAERCGMWRLRGAVCTGFYCVSDKGSKGIEFWDTLTNLLTLVEMGLAEECVSVFGYSPKEVSHMSEWINHDQSTLTQQKWSSIPEKLSRELWQEWYGDQEYFFQKCAEFASETNRKNLREIFGNLGRELESRVMELYRKNWT